MRFGWKNPEIGGRVTALRQRLGEPRIRRELTVAPPLLNRGEAEVAVGWERGAESRCCARV